MPVIPCTVMEIVTRGTVALSSGSSRNVFNVFHYTPSTSSIIPNKGHVKTAFETAIGAAYNAAISSALTPTTVGLRILDDKFDPYVEIASGLAPAGNAARAELSKCISIFLQGVKATKNFRGAKRFAPVPEACYTKDELNVVGTPLFQALRDACKATFTDSDGITWAPVNLSRSLSDFTVQPRVLQFSLLANAFLNLNVGTFRPRREKTKR